MIDGSRSLRTESDIFLGIYLLYEKLYMDSTF